MLNLSLLLEIYLGICSIAHDCTSIEKKRVVFQHDFVGKNIIDLNNIYIDEIDRSLLTTELSLACVASVSARVRRESWDESKKRNDRGGGGERRKRLPANPTILKNCVRPRTQLLIGAVLVVLIT